MKRILVFGITENPGGVESVIMNYYRNIDKSKIQFDFLCNTKDVAYQKEIISLGGKIYRITARSKNYKLYKEELEHFFKANSNKYSAIWVNVCSLANIDYLKIAQKYNIKTRIIHCHNAQNMDSSLRGLLHKFNKIFLSKYATDFWSCSKFASKFFYNSKIIKSNKYKIINNAIDLSSYIYNEKIRKNYRDELQINDKTVVYGNVGRMHFQKNQKFLLKIFMEILKKQNNAVLLLIGDGEDRKELEKIVKDNKISNKVRFLGVRNDVNKLLQAMDVFLFPSLFEGLPVALIEAQASGLLVVASSDNITDEVRIDKERFLFISLAKDASEWSDEIIKLENKNIKRENNFELMSNNGFDIVKQSKLLEEFFENL